MRTLYRLWTVSVLLAFVLAPATLASSRDWPQYRGALQDGAALGDGAFDGAFGLAVAWKQPLGSAYSAISVVGTTGVTMTTDGKDDVLVAFEINRPSAPPRLSARNHIASVSACPGTSNAPAST